MQDSPVDEIKQRLNIVDVISEYIKLTPAGTNHKAKCPFHNEKTPSFMVSPDKQIYHCFGCEKGGDIFSFVQEIEGVEFPEALRILANKAGVTLTPRDPAIHNQKTKLMDICKWATAYFQKILQDSPKAQIARDYLKERRINEETIEEFHLGYALSDWENLNIFLKKKDFKEEDIFLAGLAIKKERGTGFYDRFRGRLIFPISDAHGSVIGFTGRLIEKQEGKEMAKYINTPQTLIYNKSYALYGVDKAKQEIKKKKLVVIVEGNMDVLSSHQAGAKNVVASSGTALTREQVELLRRYSQNIAFCFDQDSAGEAATRRGLDQALAQGMNVKIIELPYGKDPDECIKKEENLWLSAIENAKSVMEYYFDLAKKKFNFDEVEDKKEATKMLLPLISKLYDSIEQTHYLQKLGSMIKVEENILRDYLKKTVKKEGIVERAETNEEKTNITAKKERNQLLTERILAIALKFKEELLNIIDNLEPEAIYKDYYPLYKRLIIYYNSNHELDFEKFRNEAKEINTDLVKQIDLLVLLAEKEFNDDSSADHRIEKESREIIKALKINHISEKLKNISLEVKKLDEDKETEKLDQLTKEFNKLTEELKEIS